MTELEELEQYLILEAKNSISNARIAVVLDCLCQSRVGAAFDQARERQATVERLTKMLPGWAD